MSCPAPTAFLLSHPNLRKQHQRGHHRTAISVPTPPPSQQKAQAIWGLKSQPGQLVSPNSSAIAISEPNHHPHLSLKEQKQTGWSDPQTPGTGTWGLARLSH